MTRQKMIKAAQDKLIEQNPLTIIRFIWELRPRLVTHPTGLREYVGKVRLEADTHKPKTVFANWTATGELDRLY